MDLQLAGATALVTGATRGIGRAVVERLVAEGCDVAVTARDAGAVAELVAGVGGRTSVVPLPGDMTDAEDVRRVVATAIQRLGHLDILVTSAGSVPGGLADAIPDEEWAAGLNSKLLGYVRLCREVLPHMEDRGTGSIVMVVGNAGLKPSPWELAAGVANAGNLNFASAIADQYADRGVRINTVNPGPVQTGRWPGSIAGLAEDRGISEEEARAALMASLPLGRVCTADDVAPVVTFLASPLAGYITGTHVVVDGAQRKALLGQ